MLIIITTPMMRWWSRNSWEIGLTENYTRPPYCSPKVLRNQQLLFYKNPSSSHNNRYRKKNEEEEISLWEQVKSKRWRRSLSISVTMGFQQKKTNHEQSQRVQKLDLTEHWASVQISRLLINKKSVKRRQNLNHMTLPKQTFIFGPVSQPGETLLSVE